MKKIVILDGKTLGDIRLEKLSEIGEVKYYDTTDISEVKERVREANIVNCTFLEIFFFFIAVISWNICPLSTIAPKGQLTRHIPHETHLS